jgi:hypothetical protein
VAPVTRTTLSAKLSSINPSFLYAIMTGLSKALDREVKQNSARHIDIRDLRLTIISRGQNSQASQTGLSCLKNESKSVGSRQSQ